MSDDKPDKPSRTLADFIPEEPKPLRRNDRKPTRAQSERLEALERAIKDTEPDAVRRRKRPPGDRSGQDLDDYYANKGWKTKPRKRGAKTKYVFWAIVIMIIVASLLD